MAKVKNESGEDRIVPALGGLVFAGQVVDVDDDGLVWGLTQQDIWEPVDKAAKDAHQRGADARDERVASERARSTVNVVPAPAERDERPGDPPAGGGE